MSSYPYASFASANPWPLTAGDVLDRVWRTLRTNWKLFLGLGVMPALAWLLPIAIIVGALFAMGILPPHPGMVLNTAAVVVESAVAYILVIVFSMIVFSLYAAATVFAALRVAEGKTTTTSEAYAAAWHKAGRYIGLALLQYLYACGPILLIALLFGGSIALTSVLYGKDNPVMIVLLFPLLFLLYIAGMVYAVWMTIKLGLAFPASVAEDLPATAALKRSISLTHKARGKLFLALLLIYLISYAAAVVIELAGGLIGGLGVLVVLALHPGQTIEIAAAVIGGLAAIALLSLYSVSTWAAYIVCFTVVYCDQRLRIDGPASAQGGAVSA